jgi:hypothetical protein
VFTNTIDTTDPTSRIKKVKAKKGSCKKLSVAWAGEDTGAGVRFFDVEVAKSGSRYVPLRSRSTAKKAKKVKLKGAGAYVFRSTATDGAGHVEGTASGLWEQVVKSAKKKGNSLVLSIDKGAAQALGAKSLAAKAGKRKAKSKKVPSKLAIKGLKRGGYNVALSAKTEGGTLKAGRGVAMCGGK